MADAALINAIKDLTRAVDAQTRVFKDIETAVSKTSRVLAAMNDNYIEVNRTSNTTITRDEEPSERSGD